MLLRTQKGRQRPKANAAVVFKFGSAVICPSWGLSYLPSWPFSSFSGSFMTSVPTRAAWFQCAGWRRRPRALQHDIRCSANQSQEKSSEERAFVRFLVWSNGGVVALARADVEPFPADANLHGVALFCPVIAPRVVAEGVLVAGLFRNARIERL